MQKMVRKEVHKLAMSLAAHRRFVDLLPASPAGMDPAITSAESDCMLPAPFSSDPPGASGFTKTQNQQEQHIDLQHECARESLSENRWRNKHNIRHCHHKESPSECAQSILDDIKPEMPENIAAARSCSSAAQKLVMCTIRKQLQDIMSQLATPAVNASDWRPQEHQHISGLSSPGKALCSKETIDAHNENDQGIDYLSAVMANTYLCQWLQLGQDDSKKFQRVIRTCEGLAVNFLYDHGASTEVV